MIKNKKWLASIVLIVTLSSCEEFNRENNREPESAPQGFAVTSIVYGEVSLTWNAVNGATEYEVFHSTDSNSSTATTLASTNLTNHIAPLTPGELYYFWITAKNGTAASPYSTTVNVAVENTLPAPTGLVVTSGSYGDVSLTWNIVRQATAYEVFYSTNYDLSTPQRFSTNLTNFDASLTPDVLYYFGVKAKTDIATSDFSNIVSVTTINTLATPQSFSATSSTYGEVSLTWNVVKKATSYEVFYSTNADSATANSLGSTNLTNLTTPLTPRERYYFWVQAKTDATTSPFSSGVSVTINNTLPAILAPTDLEATSGSYGEVSLKWNVVDDATSYEVFYSENSNSSNASSLGTTDSLKFDADLTAGVLYYFWVKAKNDTATSSYSSVASVEISKSLIETVLVEGGTFLRAGGFEITVSSFYMGTYEVTQKQWLDMTGKNPSNNKPTTGWYNYPVESVNWYDAVEFCNMLSKAEGFDPVYDIDKADSTDQSYWTVTCDFNKNGYRLPTEAEWEYAANGGTHNSNFTYSGSDDIYDVAWWRSNSSGMTHEVGGKRANALGLYDMSGNVAEWCWDLSASYPSGNLTNPMGTTTGTNRILRGGSYSKVGNFEIDCLVVSRDSDNPESNYDYQHYNNYNYYGFRVVRSVLPR